MKRALILALTILFAVQFTPGTVHCSGSQGGLTGQAQTPKSGDEPKVTRTILLSGLSNPWDLAFTQEGAMLFTEKCRGLSVRRTDGSVHRLFGTRGSAVVAGDLFCQGQSGMLGVAVDPEFDKNRFIYVFLASNLDNTRTNRVVRLTVDAGYTTVSGRKDIFTDIPYKTSASIWGGAGAHSGGRIRFSPFDGFLYVTTGDNHNGTLPQDLTGLGGKVLRIDREGAAAPGNNIPPGGDPRIFTYGHRNVQGIAFSPETGQPFSSEHGPGRVPIACTFRVRVAWAPCRTAPRMFCTNARLLHRNALFHM
ncbi:MAG TPA: hypothetical protein ENN34_12560 [Deltaproteobacteria bacterium]|nr:hypothetical protein [Deltaproteobacteria bacterium]